jgi:hypothetical protein
MREGGDNAAYRMDRFTCAGEGRKKQQAENRYREEERYFQGKG